jgi:putative ATP-dependent endonuclease of OLD family
MHISRIQIQNYRNFGQLDVTLGQHVVVVGENKVGKSNFLRALRLVLDPSLPDSARQLRTEDFWDGLPRPLAEGTRIAILIDLRGFDDNDEQLASLADFLIAADPMVARLSYVCRRLPGADDNLEFAVYGGDREDCKVTWETRRRLAMDLVPALRDVEGDLASWRRSPLRPLLDKLTSTISPSEKNAIAQEVKTASNALLDLKEVKGLGDLITSTLVSLVGGAQAADIQLGLAPTEADRLLRSLRILIDSGVRGIGEASLGVANTLYLTLKLLETQLLTSEGT